MLTQIPIQLLHMFNGDYKMDMDSTQESHIIAGFSLSSNVDANVENTFSLVLMLLY